MFATECSSQYKRSKSIDTQRLAHEHIHTYS